MEKHANDRISHDEAISLLSEWLRTAQSQICASEVLVQQLPTVNEILSDNVEEMSSEFCRIRTKIDEQSDIVGSMAANDSTTNTTTNGIKEMEGISEDIKSHLGKIVMAMQFQDRVSQNLCITIDVLSDMITHLQGTIERTQDSLQKEDQHIEVNKEFAQEILSRLYLGELKSNFIQKLISHGFIVDESDVGYKNTTDESDNQIELF